MKADFIGPASPRWIKALGGADHDVYHLPGYATLSARNEGGEPCAFLAEEGGNRLLIPMILRPTDEAGGDCPGRFDATSPYGYSGPVLHRESTADAGDFLARAAVTLLDKLLERNILCLFCRLTPHIDMSLGPLLEAGVVVQHGSTVSIDLSLPAEEIWRQTRPSYRNEILKAERQGQVVRIDPTWRAFDAFLEIYQETMLRRGAARSYRFSREYFLGLRDLLGDRLHLCVTEINGEVAAAALFTEYEGVVNYHLSGTRAAFVRSGPTKAMLHWIRSWAKGRGNRTLHLGGGLGGRTDSLFAFKAGFSELRSPFFTWRVLTDEPAYRALTRRWELQVGVGSDGSDNFFPSYRKPLDGGRAPDTTVSGTDRCPDKARGRS